MTVNRKFKSEAFDAIHSAARGLHRVGAIDKATMREFDACCVAIPQAISAADIKRIREQARVSQPVFARYLNTSESTVQKWEAGTNRPSGMALKLLAIVKKHGLKVLG